MTRTAAACLALLLAPTARAQITADRPGVAFSSDVVGVGVVQIEAGLPEATFGSGADTYQVPLQVRVGVAPGLELRVLTPVLRAVEAGGLELVMDSAAG